MTKNNREILVPHVEMPDESVTQQLITRPTVFRPRERVVVIDPNMARGPHAPEDIKHVLEYVSADEVVANEN